MSGFELSEKEIRTIIDYLAGRTLISRRREFERYSYGRGRILHRNALLYRSIIREIERKAGRIKVNIKDTGDGDALVVIEDPEHSYRRETHVPKEIARYIANRFPDIVPAFDLK